MSIGSIQGNCVNHPTAPTRTVCGRCGDFICSNCVEFHQMDEFCPTCYKKANAASTRAVTALVLGILSLNGCFFLGIPAAILGWSEMESIKNDGAHSAGRNLATGGFYLGLFTTFLTILCVIAIAAFAILGLSV